jgi:hypothetical protein
MPAVRKRTCPACHHVVHAVAENESGVVSCEHCGNVVRPVVARRRKKNRRGYLIYALIALLAVVGTLVLVGVLHRL